MKKMKTMLIFLLLGMTWLLLFFLTGNKAPWGMFDREKLKEKLLFHWGMWQEETMTEWVLMAERFFIRRLIVDGLSEP